VVLPGQESNPGSWDRIPASYHLATLTHIFRDAAYDDWFIDGVFTSFIENDITCWGIVSDQFFDHCGAIA